MNGSKHLRAEKRHVISSDKNVHSKIPLRFCITDKVAIFLSNLFDKIIGRAKIKNFNKKLSRNVAAIFFENIEKSGVRTIT
jgi:hypothetical protein